MAGEPWRDSIDHGADPERPRIVRDALTVQAMHDVLKRSLDFADQGKLRLDPAAYRAVAGGLHVTCWLLGHPSETAADTATELRDMLRAARHPNYAE